MKPKRRRRFALPAQSKKSMPIECRSGLKAALRWRCTDAAPENSVSLFRRRTVRLWS